MLYRTRGGGWYDPEPRRDTRVALPYTLNQVTRSRTTTHCVDPGYQPAYHHVVALTPEVDPRTRATHEQRARFTYIKYTPRQ